MSFFFLLTFTPYLSAFLIFLFHFFCLFTHQQADFMPPVVVDPHEPLGALTNGGGKTI
jgi:hypothetical protein